MTPCSHALIHVCLQVRRSVEKITLSMMLELVEAQEWGPSAPRIPASEAKNRLSLITAAKAVALALTPGIDPIKFVTMWSRRRGQGPYVDFIESQDNIDPAWHPEEVELMDYKTNFKVCHNLQQHALCPLIRGHRCTRR